MVREPLAVMVSEPPAPAVRLKVPLVFWNVMLLAKSATVPRLAMLLALIAA